MGILQHPRAVSRAFGHLLLSILAATTIILTSNCESFSNEEQKPLILPSPPEFKVKGYGELRHLFVSLWTFP